MEKHYSPLLQTTGCIEVHLNGSKAHLDKLLQKIFLIVKSVGELNKVFVEVTESASLQHSIRTRQIYMLVALGNAYPAFGHGLK